MAVDERRLGALHRKLDEVLGPDDAATLMTLLREAQRTGPTTQDLADLASALREEMRAVITELRTELLAGAPRQVGRH